MKPVGPKKVPSRTGATPPMGTAPVSAPGAGEGADSRERKQDYAPPTPPPVSKGGAETGSSLATVELDGSEADAAPAGTTEEPDRPAPNATASQSEPPGTPAQRAKTPHDGTPAIQAGIARERVDTAPPRRKLAPASIVVEPSARRRTAGMVIGAVVLLAMGFALRAAVDPLLNPSSPEATPPPLPAAARPELPEATPPTVAPDLEPEAEQDDERAEPEQEPEPIVPDEATEDNAPIEEDAVPRVTPQIVKPRAPRPAPHPLPPTNEPAPEASPKPVSKTAPKPAPSPRPSRSRGAIVRDTPF